MLKDLRKQVLAGVIVAVIAAVILATADALTEGWLIRLLGGATPDDVRNAISGQLLRRSAARTGWIQVPSNLLNVTQSVTFSSEFPDAPAILLLPSGVVSAPGTDGVSPEFLIEDVDTRGFRFRVLPADGLISLQVTWLAVTQTISPPGDAGHVRGPVAAGTDASAPR